MPNKDYVMLCYDIYTSHETSSKRRV